MSWDNHKKATPTTHILAATATLATIIILIVISVKGCIAYQEEKNRARFIRSLKPYLSGYEFSYDTCNVTSDRSYAAGKRYVGVSLFNVEHPRLGTAPLVMISVRMETYFGDSDLIKDFDITYPQEWYTENFMDTENRRRWKEEGEETLKYY